MPSNLNVSCRCNHKFRRGRGLPGTLRCLRLSSNRDKLYLHLVGIAPPGGKPNIQEQGQPCSMLLSKEQLVRRCCSIQPFLFTCFTGDVEDTNQRSALIISQVPSSKRNPGFVKGPIGLNDHFMRVRSTISPLVVDFGSSKWILFDDGCHVLFFAGRFSLVLTHTIVKFYINFIR